MRIGILLLAVLLTGCQTPPFLDQREERASSVMSLWRSYQQCAASDDPLLLGLLVAEFDSATMAGSEPPSWMKDWGEHVRRQPLRTSVDPHALGAACMIRAASVLAEQHRLPEARALYHKVLDRYPKHEWAYYYEQATHALSVLPPAGSPVVALRAVSSSSAQ